jgi:hypothetical protein
MFIKRSLKSSLLRRPTLHSFWYCIAHLKFLSIDLVPSLSSLSSLFSLSSLSSLSSLFSLFSLFLTKNFSKNKEVFKQKKLKFSSCMIFLADDQSGFFFF